MVNFNEYDFDNYNNFKKNFYRSISHSVNDLNSQNITIHKKLYDLTDDFKNLLKPTEDELVSLLKKINIENFIDEKLREELIFIANKNKAELITVSDKVKVVSDNFSNKILDLEIINKSHQETISVLKEEINLLQATLKFYLLPKVVKIEEGQYFGFTHIWEPLDELEFITSLFYYTKERDGLFKKNKEALKSLNFSDRVDNEMDIPF